MWLINCKLDNIFTSSLFHNWKYLLKITIKPQLYYQKVFQNSLDLQFAVYFEGCDQQLQSNFWCHWCLIPKYYTYFQKKFYSLCFCFISQVDSSLTLISMWNCECSVWPLGSNKAAIPEEATARALFLWSYSSQNCSIRICFSCSTMTIDTKHYPTFGRNSFHYRIIDCSLFIVEARYQDLMFSLWTSYIIWHFFFNKPISFMNK